MIAGIADIAGIGKAKPTTEARRHGEKQESCGSCLDGGGRGVPYVEAAAEYVSSQAAR
jgi:hypothetical protein